jgi:ATP adenylyltransferase
MESLHAPWRIEYILRPRHEPGHGSVFAAIAQSDDDEGNHVITRSRSSFAILNTHPYNGGHVLVMPYRETPNLDDLDDGELLDLWKLVRRCKQTLSDTMNPDGFNIGINLGCAAGAGIEEHLHIHIVPRWLGDTNFMPAIGQTAVLPEALAETASKLRAALSD